MSIFSPGGDDKANMPMDGYPTLNEDSFDETKNKAEKKKDAFFDGDTWRAQFSDDLTASEYQRDQCNEDIRFVMIQGGQWEGWLGDQFGTNRPRMELDMVSEHVDMFMSQFAESRPSVVYKAGDSSNASEDDCDIMNGLWRRDMQRNNGNYALYNAVHEASMGGCGAFRIRPCHVDEEDDANPHQKIKFEPIQAAYNSVIWDSNAKRYDKRDARRCTVLTFLTTDAFKDRFPDAVLSSAQHNDDRSEFDWSSPAGYYVAERYMVREKVKTSVLFRHTVTNEQVTYYTDELRKYIEELDAAGFEEVSRRKKKTREIWKATHTGAQIIEKPQRISGKWIPIIPVYAYWMFVDRQEQYYGIVRKKKDGQRLFNTQTSSLAETAATSVKEVPIFAPEQLEGPGLKDQWSQSHLANYNYLLANPLRNEGGEVIQSGPIGVVSPPQVAPALAAMMALTHDYIKETGQITQAEIPSREVSGKAIDKITKLVDLKTYTIMENIYNSLLYAGDVYKDMAADVYSSAQSLTLLNQDDTEKRIHMNQISVNEVTGDIEVINTLQGKKFDCITDIGPSFASKRDQMQENLHDLLQVIPTDNNYYPILLSMYLDTLEGSPKALKDYNNMQMLMMGVRKPQTEDEIAFLDSMKQKNSEPDPQKVYMLAEAGRAAAEADEKTANAENKMADIPVKQSQALLNLAKAAAENEKSRMDVFERVSTILQFPQSGAGGSSAP